MPDHKVLIAEPIYQALPPQVYYNRIAFWKTVFANDEEQGFYRAKPMVMGPRRGIRSARDLAIDAVVEQKATHLLFLDDDILTCDDILAQLLAVDKPIVGGLIHRDDWMPIVFRDVTLVDNPGAIEAYVGEEVGEVVWQDHPKEGAFECAAVGAGCMLIQADVLRSLLNPIAKIVDLICQYCHRVGFHAPDCPVEPRRFLFNYDETGRTMDVRFCRMARNAGFSVWCWPDKPCKQIAHY